MHHPARIAFVVALAALAAACGGSGGDDASSTAQAPPREHLRVVLDFVPNAVHTGLYVAQHRGFFEREGLDVELAAPAETSQPLAEAQRGRTDLALADLIDVTIANTAGGSLVAVAAVVQRPLVSLMALQDGAVRRPRDLEGRTVGLTGVPSDRAVSEALIAADGGDPDRARYQVIGFTSVQAVAGRTVDAAIGFWPVDGVELRRRAPARIFRLEQSGAPSFPELVVLASRETLDKRGSAVRKFLRAARAGYDATLADPERALQDLSAEVDGLDPESTAASLAAYRTVFAPDGPWGTIRPAEITRFVGWGRGHALLPRGATAEGLTDTSYLPRS